MAGAIWLHDRRAVIVLGLALAPPALAGLVLETQIEGAATPRRIAAGLVIGSLTLALADWRGRAERGAADARPLDGLLLGLAQAMALVPGISRNGATLAVCRARGFEREACDELSRDCGLGIIIGAVALRTRRNRAERRSVGGEPRMPGPAGSRGGSLVAGAVAAFVSTVAARRVFARRDRPIPLLACAAYRTALAGAVCVRLRRAEPVA